MAGYGSKEREQPFEGITTRLYAKALLIEDQHRHTGLLITTDLNGLKDAVTEPSYERISKTTGLSREEIVINASHTHSGPVRIGPRIRSTSTKRLGICTTLVLSTFRHSAPHDIRTRIDFMTSDSQSIIRLDDFLKQSGLVGTGGEAKVRIQSGEVVVNGEVETRRRKQLSIGDVVELLGERLVVDAYEQ